MDNYPPTSHDPLLTRALMAGERAWRRSQLTRARLLLELALERSEARGDVAGALSARQLLGHVALDAGELESAEAHQAEVLRQSRALRLPIGEASSLHNLGLIAGARGEQAAARRLLAEAAARYDALGHAEGAAAARANLELLRAHWARRVGGDDERG